MKFITELHKKYQNLPIWVAGSDPTLAEYPDNFFNNKISITLHLAHIKFPDATYRYANEFDRVKYLMKKYPDYLDKDNIFAWPFYKKTKAFCKKNIDINKAYFIKMRPYPPNGVRGEINWVFTHEKIKQAKEGKLTTFDGHGTCLHGAIYSDIMMGGNPINFIGCGLGTVKAKAHFGNANDIDKNMRPGTSLFSKPEGFVPMIEQTLALISGCSKEGIKINWI